VNFQKPNSGLRASQSVFLLAKNGPNENGIYYVAKSFVLKNNSPKNDRQLFFSEEGVATFMPTGYRFKSSLK
jgi:hypothetical protein